MPLEYDNNAFYYFAITAMSIYLLPGTWFAVAEMYRAFIYSGESGIKARTGAEKEKADKLKRETTGLARLKRPVFLINLGLLLVFGLLFVYLIRLVIADGHVQAFDPYHILGVDQGAETGAIKKAYRKLSLIYHPDKNTGNKVAEEMFMKIAKAYEALTDETSKENYEKYGNPDGKQSLEVSIGLPKILLENPKIVLVLYLVAMVVVIPVVVGLWYANSKQYGENNIKYESYTAFYQLIQDTHRTKNMPEVMAAAAECRAINTSKEGDNEVLSTFYEKMKTEKLMPKPKFEHAMILRGNLLLHAHMLRLTHMLNDTLKCDLENMLIKAPELIEGMIEICHQRRWLETTLATIKFSQCIVQALSYNAHPMLQIPHMTNAIIQEITNPGSSQKSNTSSSSSSMVTSAASSSGSKTNGKKENLSVTTAQGSTATMALTASNVASMAMLLQEYLRTPDAEKKGLESLSTADKQEIYDACKLIPHMKIETYLFVEEEEKDFYEDDPEAEPLPRPNPNAPKGDSIYEQDLVTLRVTLTHENVSPPVAKGKGKTPKEPSIPPVHAPYFPKTIREGWWLVLTDKSTPEGARRSSAETTIHAIEKLSDQKRVVMHELRFMAPQHAGTYEMELHVLSDSYMGLDHTIALQFTVRSASELPEYEPHPEDVELDNEPTLFEQVMAANVDDSSDDEDDDKKVRATAAAAKLAKAEDVAGAKKEKKEQERVIELVGEGEDSEED